MKLLKNSVKESTNCIDLLRVFFALGVLGIHTSAYTLLPQPFGFMVLKFWFRLGVPFFFVASGYFLGKKLLSANSSRERMDITFSFCRNNFKPLFVFGVIGLFQKIVWGGEKY